MDTKIEWADAVWNVTRGCRRVSPGCVNCYAEKQANRFKGGAYEGLVSLGKNGPRWTGAGRFVPDKLEEPLHWRKPRRIFVNSMSDLFFEEFTNEQIAAVFGVMATAHWHTFQVLTKRSERAAKWFHWLEKEARTCNGGRGMPPAAFCLCWAQRLGSSEGRLARDTATTCGQPWPLSHVQIGVSVEDKPRAEERLPYLIQIPAALRFVSYEPALEAVNFRPWLSRYRSGENCYCLTTAPARRCPRHDSPRIDWLIVGGESGNGARPFDIAWARSAVTQCKEAGVPVFVKQLGARPVESHSTSLHRSRKIGGAKFSLTIAEASYEGPLALNDSKGGDMTEWPADLRIREFPSPK